jgi:hypothetical protein
MESMNMNTAKLEELAGGWRHDAEILRRRGAPEQASALETCAEELDRQIDTWQREELTLEQAAAESGYTYWTLQKHVADGRLRNAGRKGSPRVVRQDLPRKACYHGPSLAESLLEARRTVRR